MRSFLQILSIAMLAYFAELLFPWWIITVAAFLILTIIPAKSSFEAFIKGFAGIGLLWLFLSWDIDVETESILTEKVSGLFHLTNSVYLIFITTLTGGITGGLAGWTGYAFRNTFIDTKSKSHLAGSN